MNSPYVIRSDKTTKQDTTAPKQSKCLVLLQYFQILLILGILGVLITIMVMSIKINNKMDEFLTIAKTELEILYDE